MPDITKGLLTLILPIYWDLYIYEMTELGLFMWDAKGLQLIWRHLPFLQPIFAQ